MGSMTGLGWPWLQLRPLSWNNCCAIGCWSNTSGLQRCSASVHGAAAVPPRPGSRTSTSTSTSTSTARKPRCKLTSRVRYPCERVGLLAASNVRPKLVDPNPGADLDIVARLPKASPLDKFCHRYARWPVEGEEVISSKSYPREFAELVWVLILPPRGGPSGRNAWQYQIDSDISRNFYIRSGYPLPLLLL
jgi:hypothetical protein